MKSMTIYTPESFDALNESGRREEICAWLRANTINPKEVATNAPVTVEDDEDGRRVILCAVFLRDKAGHFYEDPDVPNQVAREQRTVPCAVEPPAHWALDD